MGVREIEPFTSISWRPQAIGSPNDCARCGRYPQAGRTNLDWGGPGPDDAGMTPKKSYEKPVVEEVGTVRALTLGGGLNGVFDNLNMNNTNAPNPNVFSG